jgi:CheY-like chemotaxis protein
MGRPRKIKVEREKGFRVLIVEDDALLASSLADLFVSADFKPVIASNLPRAIERLIKERFDGIVLDLRLPEGDGEELIPFIRSEGALNEKVPIFVASGFFNPGVLARISDQINGVFFKPFDPQALLDKLKGVQVANPAKLAA